MKKKQVAEKCAVIVKVGKKTYQVALNESQENSIMFILPQLFDDHKIKLLPEELSIEFKK